ncbi:MAG: GNAT family N-acetyltransferase, partial [Gaiellales bacterium]
PALRRQVFVLHGQAWPPEAPPQPGDDLRPTHDPALDPISLLLVEDGRVLAALDVLSKPIEHAGERYAASGLSTVVTDEALRGRGYGHTLVVAAREAIEASGADLGIFTCDRELGPFYEGAGFQIVPGAVLVGGTPDDPFPSDQWDKVTLARFFSANAMRGAPAFEHARIGLYPGPIDKLW